MKKMVGLVKLYRPGVFIYIFILQDSTAAVME